ncbi:hypothetical protein A4D02_28340 [Niastella koreensis]|uniref:DoxX n=2 Tax=Niastella koreensis TaxID=354356 RepID=G8T8M0_NIAKG|nr:hypothetical protein [Niastella koreensis]AEW00192.1 DoxX [Niastella koreensis GR20-10]OQP49507.1 hypothetical protein A4D02_28340 [Niastella koreensis]
MIPAYLRQASITTARIFFGIGIMGIGIQHFIYSAFRPVILPAWPHWLQTPVLAYLIGVAIVAAGALILLGRNKKNVSLLLGSFLLFCLVFIQCPYILFGQPNSPAHLGLWTDPLKELALSGGAFVIAGISANSPKQATFSVIEKLVPFGKFFFATTLLLFGIDHFFYTEFVATLVPAWVPDHTFWTYLAGVALIGTGTAIILKIRRRRIALLASAMLFGWLILLHIPRAMADPYGAKGNEITSVFEALAFSGIALGIAVMQKSVMNNAAVTVTSTKAVAVN